MSDDKKIETPVSHPGNAGAGGALLDQQVRASAEKLKSQYQSTPGKKPVGRPRKTPGNVVVAKDTPTDQIKPGSDAGFKLDKEIVERTTRAVVGAADNAVKRKVYITGLSVGADKEHAAQLAASAAMSTEEQTLIGELTGIIFEKRGWLTGAAPEILLGTLIVAYSTRVGIVLFRLREIAQQNASVLKKANAVKSPGDESCDNG